MNGAQDLGGQMGFGPVMPEPGEPVFHADWEKRALGLTLAMGALGEWTIDESRHARETLHPVDYLSSSYYAIWLKALETLCVANGLAMRGELTSGAVEEPGRATKRPALKAIDVAPTLARGGPSRRPEPGPARFHVGDRVRTINDHPTGHTRLPRYARGRTGVIEAVHGAHVFPDSGAHKMGDDPRWLYTVVFDARAIWGASAEPGSTLSVDAWEPYLESA